MDDNYGYKVFWEQNIYNELGTNERYIITDSDLDLSLIPKNFLKVLNDGLDKYPVYDKCGFSLEIDDLPDTEIGNGAKKWEQKFWNTKLDNVYFKADIDTTFALYKHNKHSYSALRTDYPYVAKHVPWYYDIFHELPIDEQYYFNSIVTPTHWSSKVGINNLNII